MPGTGLVWPRSGSAARASVSPHTAAARAAPDHGGGAWAARCRRSMPRTLRTQGLHPAVAQPGPAPAAAGGCRRSPGTRPPPGRTAPRTGPGRTARTAGRRAPAPPPGTPGSTAHCGNISAPAPPDGDRPPSAAPAPIRSDAKAYCSRGNQSSSREGISSVFRSAIAGHLLLSQHTGPRGGKQGKSGYKIRRKPRRPLPRPLLCVKLTKKPHPPPRRGGAKKEVPP